MNTLRAILEQQILRVIPPGSEICFFDYPVYGNIGDLLIWKGTEELFRRYGIKVLKRYSVLSKLSDMTIPKNSIIVCQGGGNFGDIYTIHQELRELIISSFRNQRIVILPQTIHFQSTDRLERVREVFNSHPDLHLFVRDRESLEFARRNFPTCEVYLSPDMAHALWPLLGPKRSSMHPRLYLMRTDLETVGGQRNAITDPGVIKDWRQVMSETEFRLMRLLVSLHKRRAARESGHFPTIWFSMAARLIGSAIKEFSGYEYIVTSRLHGHLLACLMDKPNLLVDNTYGKNSRYFSAWTHRVQTATFNYSLGQKMSGEQEK